MPGAVAVLGAFLTASSLASGQASSTPQRADLRPAIDQIGSVDYATRMRASRLVRRAAAADAVPALLTAIEQHDDGYVRYRTLVLLSAFNSGSVPDVMRQALIDPNDRLRTVAYAWFERHPEPKLVAPLIERLERETSEFVRPSLIGALASLSADLRVQTALLREVNRGEDFFRSAVMEALGRHKAGYAIDSLAAIAQSDGPLQDDAALALGRIGDRRALPVLAGLQRSAAREVQPTVAAAVCLLGVNCTTHRGFLARTLAFSEETPGFQPLLRAAAAGLGALASNGDKEAAEALVEIGIPSRDPARAPIALALASTAVADPVFMLELIENTADQRALLDLVAEGFDMLEEDFAEEQFFAAVRRAYWAAPERSSRRAAAEAVIARLEF